MAPKTIQGWSLTIESKGDEPVWRLTKAGRRVITLRFEAGIDEEIAVRHAMNAIDIAEASGKNRKGDSDGS